MNEIWQKLLYKTLKRTGKGRELLRLKRLSKFYLEKEGWPASITAKMPINAEGNPLPWFTYPSIHFLENRLSTEFSVFEYGSGNSTIWFSERVGDIKSVEHDKSWFELIKHKLIRDNTEYVLRDLESGDYQVEILSHSKAFDIVVIDGRERVACAKNSVLALKESGVIIWDNSDRSRYYEGYKFLSDRGFRRIDFWGIGPSAHRNWSTSIFYRDGNCLNI